MMMKEKMMNEKEKVLKKEIDSHRS